MSTPYAPHPGMPDFGPTAPRFRFPADFLWGAATSSHQVEGGNTANDWWQWEEAGKVRHRSGDAVDHYHRFREDFESRPTFSTTPTGSRSSGAASSRKKACFRKRHSPTTAR